MDEQIRYPRITVNGSHVDVTIRLDADEAELIGIEGLGDMWWLADHLDDVYTALAWVRTGDDRTPSEWLSPLETIGKLADKLDALRDALILRHEQAGGSVRNLAATTGMPITTAQAARQRARNGDDSNPYMTWPATRSDWRATPGSDAWRDIMSARLHRAIDTGNSRLLEEVHEACQDVGIDPSTLLRVAPPPLAATEQQEAVLLALAIQVMVDHQRERLSDDQRQRHLSAATPQDQARSVILLRGGLLTNAITDMHTIDRAHELASRIHETHLRNTAP